MTVTLTQLTFQNLLLAGFNAAKYQKEYHVGVPIDEKSLFIKHNPKAIEVVLFFLLQAYASIEEPLHSNSLKSFKEKFGGCWPILDRIQAREFRNAIFKFVEELKKTGEFPNELPVRRSYLDECKGER
jgi:hypothetical protein